MKKFDFKIVYSDKSSRITTIESTSLAMAYITVIIFLEEQNNLEDNLKSVSTIGLNKKKEKK